MINAKYTVVLKSLLDDENCKSEIEKALSDYPLYRANDENLPDYLPSRARLNDKLLNRYKYREIGFEAPGRFIDELRIAMHEIMPYYNQLLKSQDIMEQLDDPFGNVDIVETFEEESTGSTSGNSKGKSTNNDETNVSTESENYNKSVKVDTPQGELSIGNKDIDSLTYASEMDYNHSSNNDSSNTLSNGETNTENESSSQSTGKISHTMTKKGNQGVNTYAHDMSELRETFLNIEQMIINDRRIRDLFMHVY